MSIKPYWDVEFQDTSDNTAGSIRCTDLGVALAQAFIQWRRTDYRYVRVVDDTIRLVVVYYPRRGTK